MSLVCGSASYRKLPELIDQTRSGRPPRDGPRSRYRRNFRNRNHASRQSLPRLLTIIEGCDYSCSYCVVPHTRGPERSRPSDAVLAEARRLADAGYTEIQLLGQTVNSYRDPSPRGLNFASLLARGRGSGGNSPRPVHHLASQRLPSRNRRRDRRDARALRPHSSPRAVRFDADSSRHAPHLHARRISRKDFLDSRRPPSHTASPATSSSAFPARRKRISRTRFRFSTPLDTTASLRSRIRRARIRRRSTCPTPSRKKKRAAASASCRNASARFKPSATKSSSASHSRCSLTLITPRAASGLDVPLAIAS